MYKTYMNIIQKFISYDCSGEKKRSNYTPSKGGVGYLGVW